MNHGFILLMLIVFNTTSFNASAQTNKVDTPVTTEQARQLFIDVHYLQAGKIKFKDVVNAHTKDLVVEKKYGVKFLKYWVDEKNGVVYCLSSASDSASVRMTHSEAHGLLPNKIYQVMSGREEPMKGKDNLYMDIHELGEGKVTPKDVAEAHKKDLAVQKKYHVNLINYWVDEKSGTVMCLAQAPDSAALIKTHGEAHGLLPIKVMKVKQGQ
jgi:hypothetical protein